MKIKVYSVFPAFGIMSHAGKRLERIARVTLRRSSARPERDELAKLLREYDVIVGGVFEKFDRELFEKISPGSLRGRPRLIALMSRGTDSVDMELAGKNKISVVNTKGLNSVATAEHAMSLILALAKQLGSAEKSLRKGEGWQWRVKRKPFELSGKNLGVLGAGTIARKVMAMARVFGMNIMCHTVSPHKYRHLSEELGVVFAPLDAVLRNAHVLTVHFPLKPGTENLVSREKLSFMRPGSLFINTSRGEIVDEDALCDAIESGHILGAGIDVFKNEPQVNPRLLALPEERVILTPHSASQTMEAKSAMEEFLADEIVKWAAETNLQVPEIKKLNPEMGYEKK